jgi:hypothetical protein
MRILSISPSPTAIGAATAGANAVPGMSTAIRSGPVSALYLN